MSNKKHIVNIANQIYAETLNANNFLELIKQYREFQNIYNDEMICRNLVCLLYHE